jgi:hypothetical protein
MTACYNLVPKLGLETQGAKLRLAASDRLGAELLDARAQAELGHEGNIGP